MCCFCCVFVNRVEKHRRAEDQYLSKRKGKRVTLPYLAFSIQESFPTHCHMQNRDASYKNLPLKYGHYRRISANQVLLFLALVDVCLYMEYALTTTWVLANVWRRRVRNLEEHSIVLSAHPQICVPMRQRKRHNRFFEIACVCIAMLA